VHALSPGRERTHAADTPSSTLSVRSAARRLVEALVARGVDTFFGVPGGPVAPVFEALRLHPGATLIESRHESHAAFAAALYQRASGTTPCVVVTAGPGVTNVVTGVASASLERIPMLIIAGDVAWATTGGLLAQASGPEGTAIEEMLRPITRAQMRAASARSVVSQALGALDAAENPRHPGPSVFVLPLDRAMEECNAIEIVRTRDERPCPPAPELVARTLRELANAERPLIVIGAGCRGHEASLARLVERTGLPFVTTPRAKGLVRETSPSSLRNGGMAASLWARRYTAEPVDVCLVLGTDLDDTSMGPTPYARSETRVIHVDADARVFGRNVPTALGIVGDVGAFAEALCERVPADFRPTAAALDALARARRESPFDVAEPHTCQALPIRPHRLLCDVQAALPGARFVTDIGEHMLFALHYLTADRPLGFHVQLNLGSMGSGIAGAVGLALADPGQPVVCIAGDGCMQMAGMEALVALRARLPVLFVVFNDGRYNMVHHGMKQIFGGASPYATPPVDFAQWARALGMPSLVVHAPGEIDAHTCAELLADGPALIDARIDASVRIRGGGRVEALQHMSMLSQLKNQEGTSP
jgi:acetolactate synthase I/II/III large subunit